MNRTRVVVALGVAQTIAWGATYYLPATLAAPIASDLGVAPPLVFAAFSAALVVSAIVGPWVGRRIDRFGGRTMLASANLLCAAGLVLLAAAGSRTGLFAAWLLIGAGMGCGLYEAAFSTLAGLFGRNARGPITGITLFAGFASTLSWPATTMMASEFGWRAACLAWAAVLVTIALPLTLSIPRPSLQADPDGMLEAAPQRTPLGPMALLGFVFAATWFTSTAMAAHLPGLLVAAGAAPAAAVAAAALVGPAQVGARAVEYAFIRHSSPLLSARIATLAHPVGAGLLLSIGAPAAPVFTVLHGAGNGVMTIASGTLPLALFGPAGYGLRQGLLAMPARLAAVLAPFVFAVLIERFGAGALWVSSALGLASLAALLALGLADRRRRR
jgi:MFS family permease